MAESAVTAALSKLGELAVSEAKILLQVGDDLVLLQDRLEWLQAFVRDADRKRRAGTDGLTRVWVRQTRDVAFEAEDALDDFFHEEVVGPKGHGCCPSWKKLRRKYLTCLFAEVVVRYGLSGRIKTIKSRLEQISENQKEYQIQHTPSVVLASSTTAIAAWRDDLENAVGFDQDLKIVKQMMAHKDGVVYDIWGSRYCHNPDHLMFISVVGESGAGKNTLAKIINSEMKSETDILVWYNMKPGSREIDLIKELYFRAFYQRAYHQRFPDNHGEHDQSDPEPCYHYTVKLHHALDGARYLLILGGISSKTVFNSLRASLPDNGIGSRVILLLDSENEEVAWHANSMNRDGINRVHLLTRLDRARSGQLFFWKVLRKGHQESLQSLARRRSENYYYWWVFWNSRNPKDDEYTELVHDITGGYPMAIVLLAGLVRFKEKPVEWDAVLQQLKSGTQAGGNNDNNINQQAAGNLCSTRRRMEMIFWTSFEELPNDLRSCFLYLAFCPNSSRLLLADQIVRMWIAEGFINNPCHGKTLEEVGHDYLKELVLRCLVEVVEMKVGGGIQFVRVHNTLMGFLQWEVRESGFMEIINIVHDVRVPPTARRLSVQSDNSRRCATTFAKKKLPKLRSFICRIINKEDNDAQFSHDLDFLLASKFIRVISVQGPRRCKLPDNIGDMINLRYLRIDCFAVMKLPRSISGLHNLQTLDIRNTHVQEIDLDFWKIKTLRHVLASYLTLPKKMPAIAEEDGGGGGGSELQTLHGVKPDASNKWTAENCPLNKMTSLESLEMHRFLHEQHAGYAFDAALGNMRLLGHLILEGDVIPLSVLMEQSLGSLKTMALRGEVNWNDIGDLRHVRPNLVQLKLHDINVVPQRIKHQLGKILIQG